jgi:hypothetical protein
VGLYDPDADTDTFFPPTSLTSLSHLGAFAPRNPLVFSRGKSEVCTTFSVEASQRQVPQPAAAEAVSAV